MLTSERIGSGLTEIMETWTILDLMDVTDALDFRREMDAASRKWAEVTRPK